MSVFNASGLLSIRFDMAVCTKAVEANLVVLSVALCVVVTPVIVLLPKFGLTFVPSIAASLAIFTFLIVPVPKSTIGSLDKTTPKNAVPLVGAVAKVIVPLRVLIV